MSLHTPKRASSLVTPVDQPDADTPPIPPKKRPCLDDSLDNIQPDNEDDVVSRFRPQNMRLVSVLSADSRTKRLVLHTRFDHMPEKDAIVILEKSPFPREPQEIVRNQIVSGCVQAEQGALPSSPDDDDKAMLEQNSKFPDWRAKLLLSNDVYHRLFVTGGLDSVAGVDVTVIHPAEEHHFKKYIASGRRIIQETPEMYQSIIVPFLQEKPRDLGWVDNILSGKAELDRVLFTDTDPQSGFTLVLDYRWNGRQLHELHCLAIAQASDLTCLRDLRASHVPMLKRILTEGRQRLSAKYSTSAALENGDHVTQLDVDQIMAYLHYPPTFYHLHVHFIHVNAGDDGGTRSGRAHLLEEVIRNLESDSDYYAKRTMTIYMYEESPMLRAVQDKTEKVS